MRNTRAMFTELLIGTLLLSIQAVSQQKPDDAAMKEMMMKMEAVMAPGPSHKILASMEGTWDTETTMWMGGPGNQSEATKGTSTMRMILGGRFLQQEMTGQIMGKPYHGLGFTGYDNNDKKFVGVWVDDMGTSISTMEGTTNHEGTVLTMFGKMDEPTTGEHDKTVKYVNRIINKDKVVFEIHDMSIGEPNTKVMEIVYTRHK